MRIDIHRPEVEAFISECLQSGNFESAEDVIWQALRSFKPSAPGDASPANLVDAFAPVRGLLTDIEVDSLFSRNPLTGRPVDLG